MDSKKIKIGLLGCGAIAQYAHLPALLKARGIALNAVCDKSKFLLEKISAGLDGVSRHTDLDEFLSLGEFDAVVIATADAFHVPLAIRCLQAGKHVLVEKPLGTNVKECQQLIAEMQKCERLCQVGSMKRHDPGIRFAKEFIEKEMGEVLSLSGWYCDSLYRPDFQESLLAPLLTDSGSIKPGRDPKADLEHYSLVTHGAHLMDILQYLGGDIKSLCAQHTTKFGQHSWQGLLNFKEGATGQFELSVKINGDWSEGYRVSGEHGCVEIKTFLPFYYRPSEVRVFRGKTQSWESPLGARSNPYQLQLEEFARAIKGHRQPNPGAHEGKQVVQLLEGIEASLSRGLMVDIQSQEFVGVA